MSLKLFTDKEIIATLGERLDYIRREKEIPVKELAKRSGTNTDTLTRFFNGKSSISLTSFVRILRGLGELDALEPLFKQEQEYSPITGAPQEPKKRIYKKHPTLKGVIWGEDR
ncbi:helix-turn-helix transcriptional regulator [Sulfurospirillum sp. T05]|uniref:Helix-turn-helix transcriptional regulator n=1 Tax=Sulfurospirillum tamanense TaxID=2813362 RepID=A0ABS2WVE5_9BACT|nr:helix-turn-helix transcriptional regulator [Sulfurospirillum tamanensis]MBN2965548.1 helix-turn-helix transcriptional regulator [Sulfurospirillum tamanensis]